MSEYRFERLSDSNLKDLISLYLHAFNEKTSLDFLQKKYATSSFGLQFIGFIAYSGKEPAAYYGVFPIKVKHNSIEYLAAQSGDTMTHPNHRGKGLFIKLAKMSYDLAKSNGVQFIFGFPNENSYPGFVKKLEWKHYANINNYKIATEVFPFEKIAKKFKFFEPYYQKMLAKKLAGFSASIFENSLSHQSKNYGYVIHDQNYLNYKNYYKSYIVELNGVRCWIKIDGRLWVGDIEFCNEQKFKETLSSLLKLSKTLKCSSVHFSVFENSNYDKYLSEYTKPYYKNAVGCLNLSENVLGEYFAYQSADFDTF